MWSENVSNEGLAVHLLFHTHVNTQTNLLALRGSTVCQQYSVVRHLITEAHLVAEFKEARHRCRPCLRGLQVEGIRVLGQGWTTGVKCQMSLGRF